MLTADLLLSWDDYNKQDFSRIPYLYSIQKANQLFQYFGAQHKFTPDHPQFKQLKECWNEFLTETNSKNNVVMLEGDLREVAANEHDAIVIQGGEGGLITYLASKTSCEIICPEPNNSEVVNTLLKKYTREEVLYNRLAQIIIQWHKYEPRQPFEEYINHFLERYRDRYQWLNFEFTLDHFEQIHQQLFNSTFNQNAKNFLQSQVSPSEYNSRINEISRNENLIRDSKIVDTIKEHWDQGKNIFIVFSFSHAMIQEPAIKHLLT